MTSTAASDPAETIAPVARVDYRYGWYVTVVLMAAYTFSFLDRQILTLMVGPIERDLHIGDSQFALLTGGAFGIFYTIMGLPLGWAADRFSRKWIISVGVACWSVMTATCGFAGAYAHLFLARIGVGVGEAALSPSAYSMLSDSFDKKRLPRALSIYTVGIFIGAGLALIIGGEIVAQVQRTPSLTLPVIGAMRSWHLVFLIVGLPGLLLALWISTLREPSRKEAEGVAAVLAEPGLSFREVFAFIGRYPWMSLSLFLGSALFSILGYADAWYPEMFIRTWGWSVDLSGRVNGASSLIAGPLGLVFAGWCSSHLLAKGQTDACLRLTGYGALGIALPATLMPIAPNAVVMALLLIPIKFCVGFTPVLIPSAIQMIAPNRLRGQLGAVFLFTVGIIGVSCGPILPALFSDYVFKGASALRFSLSLSALIVGPVAFIGLSLGLKQYRQRYAEVAAEAAGAAAP
jgi:MFS family permease